MNKNKGNSCFADPALLELQQELLDICKDGDIELINLIFDGADGLKYQRELLETRDKDKKTILHLVRKNTNKHLAILLWT